MKRFFIALILFCLICSSAIYYIGCTTPGLRLCIKMVTHFIPELSIQAGSGQIINHFVLTNIAYKNPDKNLHINKIDVIWNPFGILQDKLVIEKLELSNALMQIKPTQSSQSAGMNLAWLRYILVKQFIINSLRIQNTNAEAEFKGTLTNVWNAQWRIYIPKLATVIPKSKGELSSTGNISGPFQTPLIRGMLQGKNLSFEKKFIRLLDGKLNINLQPNTSSRITLSAANVKINDNQFKKLDLDTEAHVTQHKNNVVAHLAILFAKQYKINANISLPEFTYFSDLKQPIQIDAHINSSQLDFLKKIIPEGRDPQGNADLQVKITGTAIDPVITADLKLTKGQLNFPRLGIHLNKIILQASLNPNKQIHYQGTFQSGEGTGNVVGLWDLAQENFPTTLTVQGNNLQIIDLPEYKIFANPNLKLNFVTPYLQLQGDLFIPKAEITPKNFSNTVTLPDEVIIMDDPQKHNKLPTIVNMALQINLRLGDQIHVIYQDLETYLNGKLQINQNPNRVATATGELSANKGVYHAYGQLLQIQDGRLIFSGDALLNPGLHIRAVKQVKTVSLSNKSHFEQSNQSAVPVGTDLLTVGIQIEGTLDSHKVSLFSSPSGMSQNDILSYLTLGHSFAQTSGQKYGALLNATSALSTKTSLGHVTNTLQNKLGLSELNVGSAEVFDPASGKVSSATTFMIGKDLGHDIHAQYSKGIFDPIQIFNLRYQLSKRFAIQSETSTMGNGADLLYSLERD